MSFPHPKRTDAKKRDIGPGRQAECYKPSERRGHEAAQRMEASGPVANASIPRASGPSFDVRRLEGQTRLGQWLWSWVRYPYLQHVLDAARWLKPVWRIPFLGFTLVLRYDHVRQVLSSSRQFPVPWDWKMVEVTAEPAGTTQPDRHGGRNFVLGMRQADPAYDNDYGLLAYAFAYDDVRAVVAARTQEVSSAALNHHSKAHRDAPFDVVEQLVLRVPTKLCDLYYGIPIADNEIIDFGKSTLPVSSFLFGPDSGQPSKQWRESESAKMAFDAAAVLRHTIRSAMAGASRVDPPHTPLARLMNKPSKFGTLDEDRIHVQLFGMVMGFIPTNVLAGGNIVETLLDRPELMAKAVAAAHAPDRNRLWRILRETLRLRNINLGPFRICVEPHELTDLRGEPVRIRVGEKILACSQSAMFDGRRIKHPHDFDSDRPDEDYLMFGVGQHWCIGAYIATVQLTEMFRVLLTEYDVAPLSGRDGRMKRFGVYPLHMNVRLTKLKH